ncbi:MAG: hypothetical protein DMF09_10050 [Verrucomicrobia bacterium]|jgi:hypothetical protein|nr:MAG: hypothetical protein DMF09_10050 [Verrucomicrobiota bacterium]
MVSELRCDAIDLPLFQLTEERVRLARGRLRSVGYSRHSVELVIGYTEFYSRSHDAVIRVYGAVGNVNETHEHAGEFKEPSGA